MSCIQIYTVPVQIDPCIAGAPACETAEGRNGKGRALTEVLEQAERRRDAGFDDQLSELAIGDVQPAGASHSAPQGGAIGRLRAAGGIERHLRQPALPDARDACSDLRPRGVVPHAEMLRHSL